MSTSIDKALLPGEQILLIAKPTRVTLIPPAVLMVVFLILALVFRFVIESSAAMLAFFAFALIAAVVTAWQWVGLLGQTYVLTSRRIIKQTGILSKQTMDAYLDKINNVEHRQTLIQRMLNYGHVEIDTASETGTTVLPMVARPLELKRAILTARDEQRTGAPTTTAAERLRELQRLLDEGLITKEEHEARRRVLVNQL